MVILFGADFTKGALIAGVKCYTIKVISYTIHTLLKSGIWHFQAKKERYPFHKGRRSIKLGDVNQ
jgi:hypothetical protein